MDKLELLKVDGEWVAKYKGEEAHSIDGVDIGDIISNACNIWGINLHEEITDIDVRY